MKKVGIFALFSIIFFNYSCKECKHNVKTELGKLTKDSSDVNPIDSIVIGLKFNGMPSYAFENEELRQYINTIDSAEVYRYFATFEPKTLGNHEDSISGWFIELVAHKSKLVEQNKLLGDYGCIPQFTIVNNKVLRTKDGKIPIIIAVHPKPMTNDPIQPTSDFFPIEDIDYNKLNELIVNNPKIKYEGGLDDPPSIKKMIVYKNRTEKALCINIEQSGCPK